ncbi:MAG TPA: hypothetical protein V6C89_20985 [Drouetiella sp.]|jgi:hypothetical protein
MTYRHDSGAHHRGNISDSLHLQFNAAIYSTNHSEKIYSDHYDRPAQLQNCDISRQGALEAWAPRGCVPNNDYRNPDTFRNPYDDLGNAEQLMHSQGFGAARGAYLRSIKDADGINVDNLRDDRRYDLQNLRDLNEREAQLANAGGSFEQIQNLEYQRQQIFNNERELHNLYYAPANTRISMGLACIKTGDPMEIMEGRRLIAEAREKRPEIADDPRLERAIDNAYQIGYRNQHPSVRPHAQYRYDLPSVRTDAPLPEITNSYQPPAQESTRPQYTPQYRPRYSPSDAPLHIEPSVNSNYPRPLENTKINPEQKVVPTDPSSLPPLEVHTEQKNTSPDPSANPSARRQDVPVEPKVIPMPPASPHLEISAPPGLPNDHSRPTSALQENSQRRVSDAEAMSWLHSRYQHLTIEQKQQNDRDAQKAYDQTPSSWSYFTPDWDTRARGNKQAKLVEFSNGFRADLTDLYATSSQPPSRDSDMARQALITIIKNSASNMSNEAINREISQEATAQVKELCRNGANGRRDMVDAVRIGLTESAHIPDGAKTNLIDGLELLAGDGQPILTADAAGRLTLLALKHELDNTPRLGAPDQPGQSRGGCVERQIRLIQLLDKFGYRNALADLADLAKSSADDQIRVAAAEAFKHLH